MLNKEEVLTGTRPKIEERILVTEKDNFEGYQVTDYKSLVWGIALKISNPESSSVEKAEEARTKAVDKMLEQAKELGANAVINFRFEKTKIGTTVEEIAACGNAVEIQPVKDFAPKGSLGNIFAEFLELYTRDDVKYSNAIHEARYSTVKFEDRKKAIVASPIAEITKIGTTPYALCPDCGMKYKVSKDEDGNLEVMGLKDVDEEEDGLQIFCIRCGTKFTIPEEDE